MKYLSTILEYLLTHVWPKQLLLQVEHDLGCLVTQPTIDNLLLKIISALIKRKPFSFTKNFMMCITTVFLKLNTSGLLNKKGDCNKIYTKNHFTVIYAPYAGIIRIRYSGYDLSPYDMNGHPCELKNKDKVFLFKFKFCIFSQYL